MAKSHSEMTSIPISKSVSVSLPASCRFAYKEQPSFVSSVVCYGICAVAWCAELDEEVPKSKFLFAFIIGFAYGITCSHNLIADNHNIFPIVGWQ